ncbi:hypothetical protein FB45DRAFT_1053356 [Roridomyces roridus]|uniref:Uncharacterized protein n=1 Tax=Roridomyces roridus TaxID=1738132 RepID=A0AAD7CC96_9AGAR|nr:hypothetical protein FB45DRAFT_1053356 [Roridomyces roridus]
MDASESVSYSVAGTWVVDEIERCSFGRAMARREAEECVRKWQAPQWSSVSYIKPCPVTGVTYLSSSRPTTSDHPHPPSPSNAPPHQPPPPSSAAALFFSIHPLPPCVRVQPPRAYLNSPCLTRQSHSIILVGVHYLSLHLAPSFSVAS